MAPKTLDISQGRTLIPERWDTNEMSPMTVQTSFPDSVGGGETQAEPRDLPELRK